MPARGTLYLVVGPSGAGKDSLIDGARAVLAGAGTHVFARRAITRPAEAGGEAHEALSPDAFAARAAAGGFALSWSAHGLRYGISARILTDLARGRGVVANVSRGVVADARRLSDVVVVHVTAPPEVLARRLAARGREAGADVAARLARTATVPGDARTVLNDADLATGVRRLLQAIDASPA